MKTSSKKTPLIVLGLTSLILSRVFFFFVNDPEGPNLLIVVGLALVIYFVFLVIFYLYEQVIKRPSSKNKMQ